MLQLNISGGSQQGSTEMYIDYQSGSVSFIVIAPDNTQYDFHLEKEEWEIFKTFIEKQMENNGNELNNLNIDHD